MMDKEEVYRFLEVRGIAFEKMEHKAVFNMKEMAEVGLPHPEADAKNLFLRDDKKSAYYLVTVKGDKHMDLKQFHEKQGTRRLSFASDADLISILGLIPGAVTPFGLLNDAGSKVKFYLDEDFLKPPGMIAVHPNDNTATVWLKTSDLLRIISEHGNEVHVFSCGS